MAKQSEILAFIQKTINNKFNTKAKGYDPDEVDATLDEIFEKFATYIENHYQLEKQYNVLKQENQELNDNFTNLEKENKILKSKLKQLETSGISLNVLNERLNSLEKQVETNKKEHLLNSSHKKD